MTDLPIPSLPEQAFFIGQRVCTPLGTTPISFVITAIHQGSGGVLRYGWDMWNCMYQSYQLVLAPEHPPYVPSERYVVKRALNGGARDWNDVMIQGSFRCETDAELQSRHAHERAAYDRAIL